MGLLKSYPEEEGPVTGLAKERRKRVCHNARVPLKLTLRVRPEMGLGHVAREVALVPEQGGKNPFAIPQWGVEVFGSRGVRVLARQHADA
jgi:hypothetical protein